jgi:hypothetical protein
MKKMIGAVSIVGWVLLSSGAEAVRAQSSNWSAVRALRSGQNVQVLVQGKEITGEFQSVTESWLVMTHRGDVIYLDRPDVQRVATVTGPSYRRTLIGLAIGVPWGVGTVQGGGWKGVPITMGVFGGIGALIDWHNSRRTEQVVTVYSAP